MEKEPKPLLSPEEIGRRKSILYIAAMFKIRDEKTISILEQSGFDSHITQTNFIDTLLSFPDDFHEETLNALYKRAAGYIDSLDEQARADLLDQSTH